jgi:hypothetical protein
MAIYSVSYDLSNPGQNYSQLIEELESSPDWWHYLQSTWLISTRETAHQLSKRLLGHMDANDKLLVIEVRMHFDGWLPEDAWDWINQRAAA